MTDERLQRVRTARAIDQIGQCEAIRTARDRDYRAVAGRDRELGERGLEPRDQRVHAPEYKVRCDPAPGADRGDRAVLAQGGWKWSDGRDD